MKKKEKTMWIKKEDLEPLVNKNFSSSIEMWNFLKEQKKSKVSIINVIASLLILIGLLILNTLSVEENSNIMFMVSIVLMFSYMVVCFLKINDKRNFIANITELIIVVLFIYFINSLFGFFNFFNVKFYNITDLFFTNIENNMSIVSILLGIVLSTYLFIKNKNNLLISLIFLMLIGIVVKYSMLFNQDTKIWITYSLGLFSLLTVLVSKIKNIENYTQTLTSVAFVMMSFMFNDLDSLVILLSIGFLLTNIIVWKDVLFTRVAYSVLFIQAINIYNFRSLELIILMVLSIAYAIRNKDIKLVGLFSLILLVIIEEYFKLEFIEQVIYYIIAGLLLLSGNYIYQKKIKKPI